MAPRRFPGARVTVRRERRREAPRAVQRAAGALPAPWACRRIRALPPTRAGRAERPSSSPRRAPTARGRRRTPARPGAFGETRRPMPTWPGNGPAWRGSRGTGERDDAPSPLALRLAGALSPRLRVRRPVTRLMTGRCRSGRGHTAPVAPPKSLRLRSSSRLRSIEILRGFDSRRLHRQAAGRDTSPPP